MVRYNGLTAAEWSAVRVIEKIIEGQDSKCAACSCEIDLHNSQVFVYQQVNVVRVCTTCFRLSHHTPEYLRSLADYLQDANTR